MLTKTVDMNRKSMSMPVCVEWGGCVCVGVCVRGSVNCAFNVVMRIFCVLID